MAGNVAAAARKLPRQVAREIGFGQHVKLFEVLEPCFCLQQVCQCTRVMFQLDSVKNAIL